MKLDNTFYNLVYWKHTEPLKESSGTSTAFLCGGNIRSSHCNLTARSCQMFYMHFHITRVALEININDVSWSNWVLRSSEDDQCQCVAKYVCCFQLINQCADYILYVITSADVTGSGLSPGPRTMLQGSPSVAPWVYHCFCHTSVENFA